MTVKQQISEYFFKYKRIYRKIIEKESEYDELEEKYINATNYQNEKTSSFVPKGLEQKAIQLEKISSKIEELYSKLEKTKEKYVKDFEKLSKEEYKIILTNYYLDYISIKKIAFKLKKSEGHIKKLKREAINELLKFVIEKQNT